MLHLLSKAGLWSQVQARSSWPVAVALTAVASGGAYHLRKYWRARERLSSGQLIAITGCDSGLGYSLAVHCRDLGCSVIASVLLKNGPAALDLTRRGARVLQLDLTDERSVQRFGDDVEHILEEDQLELRALVNNAGVMIFGEFEWQLAKQACAQLEVNVLGTMAITKRLMPAIRKHSSRIINVSSHCAEASLPGLSVYGASKAAIHAWSTSLRVELAKYGIKVVAFVPGSFARESSLLAQQSRHSDEMRAAMSDETKQFYGDYFERYVGYLTALSNNDGTLRRLENPKVYEKFDGALLDVNPSSVYKCEPWRYKLYHALFRITPTRTRDWLVERFVQMPAWNPQDQVPNRRRDNTDGSMGSARKRIS